MKRLIVVLVSIMMIAGLAAVSFAANQEDLKGNFSPPDSNTPINMNGAAFDTIGSVFSLAADAKAVSFVCPSWSENYGSLTVTLWKFNTDYAATVAAAPLAGPKEFVDFEDNSKIGFEFETPIPAGVYYMELSDAVDEKGYGVGVWSCEANYPGQAVFRDGEFIDKLSLRMIVEFAQTPEGDPYGEMPKFQKADNGLGGDGLLPSAMYVKMAEQDLSDLEEEGAAVQISTNEDGTMHVIIREGTVDSKFSINFALLFDVDEDADADCRTFPYLALRLRLCDNTYDAGPGEAFMYTSTVSGATGGYSSAIRYDYSTTEWQTVVVDPTANKSFLDNALDGDDWLGFRFDPLNGTPKQDVAIDIDWIALFESEEAALAFDGDFSKVEEAKPTKAPDPTPTAPPEPADAPESTDAATDEPAPTDDQKTKKGCGTLIGGAFAVVSLAAAAVVVARKKEN